MRLLLLLLRCTRSTVHNGNAKTWVPDNWFLQPSWVLPWDFHFFMLVLRWEATASVRSLGPLDPSQLGSSK